MFMTYDRHENAFAKWADAWLKRRRAQRARDAATQPTRANIEAYFRNALRSSGDESVAYDKTCRAFDLADLEIDDNGKVLSFRVADEETEPREVARRLEERAIEREGDDEHGDIEDRAHPAPFSAGLDHVAALRRLNETNRRAHDRRAQPAHDTGMNTTRQPTAAERRALSPSQPTGITGLKAFNALAARVWGGR